MRDADPVLIEKAHKMYDRAAGEISKGVPKLAKKYIGRNIVGEMKNDTRLGPRIQRQMAVLFALSGELTALECLFKALLYEFSARYPVSAMQCEATRATYRWCAEQVNLGGYSELFDGLIIAHDKHEKGSLEIGRYVTNETEENLKYYGNPEGPFAKWWSIDKISTMQLFLEEIAWLAIFRQYPQIRYVEDFSDGPREFVFGNDLGWSSEQFDEELSANKLVVRKFLGLDPKLPDYPENPRVDIPPEFRGFI